MITRLIEKLKDGRYLYWNKDISIKEEEKLTIIEHDVWIDYGCIIRTGLKIGQGALATAGAMVTRDVPPCAIFSETSAKLIR